MKLYHPTLPGVTVDVPKRDIKKWTDQGWRKTPPKSEPSE